MTRLQVELPHVIYKLVRSSFIIRPQCGNIHAVLNLRTGAGDYLLDNENRFILPWHLTSMKRWLYRQTEKKLRKLSNLRGPMLNFEKKWLSVSLLAICQVFALSLWFSATAVIPVLKQDYGLSGAQASLFTSAVSIGFVTGTLFSAIFGLADRIPIRVFFALSTLFAALVNLLIVFLDPLSTTVIILRFLTGMAMAGIYPVGMKMVSTWARGDTGLLVGLLVGALTLGSASPHLLNIVNLSWLDWQLTIVLSSLLALISALLIFFVQFGHALPKAPAFDPKIALYSWHYKPLRYANIGYFGHMWELYAMWGWVGIFLLESFRLYGLENASLWANFGTFATIGIGAVGSLMAGIFADKLGRTTITIAAMAVSGSCAIATVFIFGSAPWLVILLSLIWGLTVVADSAQFSSCVMELSPKENLGTMLTVQTCLGFLISLATIHLVPLLVDVTSWEYAFIPLALGPFIGILAMMKLRRLPEAGLLANGNK